eukprot:5348593-Prymnesium_polylepis.1
MQRLTPEKPPYASSRRRACVGGADPPPLGDCPQRCVRALLLEVSGASKLLPHYCPPAPTT